MLETGPKFKRALRLFDYLFIAWTMLTVFVFFFLVLSYKPDRQSVFRQVRAQGLDIAVSQPFYVPGEEVAVKLSNYSDTAFAQDFEPPVEVAARKEFGNNYKIAMIEKKIGRSWLAIEPLWRCEGDCRLPCPGPKRLKARLEEVYKWDQQISICRSDSPEVEKKWAGTGEYRISAASLDLTAREPKIIYSNVFLIKEQ